VATCGNAREFWGFLKMLTSEVIDDQTLGYDVNLLSLFARMLDGTIVVAKSGHVLFANAAAGKMLNLHSKKLIGHLFPYSVTTNTPVELQITRSNGETRVLEMLATETTWHNCPSYFIIVRDITRRGKAEAENKLLLAALEKIENRLGQAERMEAIGTLAGGIAHDFNNILSAIIGYTQLILMDSKNDPKRCADLREVLNASYRAKDLVRQILSFSRQTCNRKAPMSPAPIIEEVIKLLRASLPSTIEIKHSISAKKELIEAQPTQIHQAIMNLAINAAHAMNDTGGVLAIGLDTVELGSDAFKTHPNLASGQYLRLEISDTGCGIEPGIADRIFEPYFTTKNKEEGTGLGLSVVNSIVNSLNGAVTVYSEVGVGTTVHVYLPIIERKNFPSGTETEEVLPAGHEHILLIDDEPAIADTTRRALEKLGYEVTIRTSSIEALELFKKQPERFDLVIADLTMPKMTGDTLSAKILELKPSMPIILCTGFSVKISGSRAEKIGVKKLLIKPLLIKELANGIREVLDRNKRKI